MFKVEFETSKSFMGDHLDYVYEIKGKLLFYDAEKEKHIQAGSIHAYYVDAEANREFPLHDIYDAHSDNIYRYFNILFDLKTKYFKEEIEKQFGDSFGSRNVLVIDRLEVSEKYRGKDYGLVLLYNTIQVYENNCSYVVLEAFPLQFSNRDNKEEFSNEKQEGIKKLQKHYGKLGFKHIKNTPFMIYNTSIIQPRLELDWSTDNVNIVKDKVIEATS